MNGMSLREKAVLSSLGMILLYGLAIALWFTSQEAAWRKAAKTYERAKSQYESERRLIGEKAKWNQAYEDEKALMPTFEVGKSTDTTWLGKMDSLAAKHHITISQRQSGKETESGEVLELPIEVKNWEGALESLVKFMHELENTEEGMFAITDLSFRPSSKASAASGFG